MVVGSTEIYIETNKPGPKISYEFRGNSHYLSDIFGVSTSLLQKVDQLLQSKDAYAEISSYKDGILISTSSDNKFQSQLRKDLKKILSTFQKNGKYKVGSRSDVVKSSSKKKRRRRSKSKK